MEHTVELGQTGTASRFIGEADLAPAVGSGSVDVFATPVMIALMEAAAVDALADVLPEGLTSVGIYIEVHHLAATPEQMLVNAQATVTEIDGRVITFEVIASDRHETIGRGIHRRAVVDSARFLERVTAKSEND